MASMSAVLASIQMNDIYRSFTTGGLL